MHSIQNIIFAIVFFAFLTTCTGITCYYCSTGLPGCNDPFNKTGYNVTNYSNPANAYCVKRKLSNTVVQRYGSATCSNVPFVDDVGTACCQTDLCNNAQSVYKIPLLIVLDFILMIKFLFN